MATFTSSRFGQVRSPVKVELKKDGNSESGLPDFGFGNDDYIGIAVDGEIYKVRGGLSLNVYIDPLLPKLRIMRRMPNPEKDIT